MTNLDPTLGLYSVFGSAVLSCRREMNAVVTEWIDAMRLRPDCGFALTKREALRKAIADRPKS